MKIKDGIERLVKLSVSLVAILVSMVAIKINVQAAEDNLTNSAGFYAYIPVSAEYNQPISTVIVDGKEYLFLPSCVNNKSIYFHYNEGVSIVLKGEKNERAITSDSAVNIADMLTGSLDDGSRKLSLILTDEKGVAKEHDLYVMNSSGISSVYLVSANPNEGRPFVEKSKSNKTKGAMVMLNATGKTVYAGGLSQIKGRGNTTFNATKKPYQIKLENATDLTMSGKSINESKTWVLLANAYDPTLVHNTIAYRMGTAMGLNSPDCIPVDLYYDSSYRGTYLLSEKVEIGSGRVDIVNLEKNTEKANGDKDLSKQALAMGANQYGDIYQYVKNVNNAENYKEGYLLEQDDVYYKSERCYFITSTGTPFVVKSPENCSKEMMEYISSYVEEMIQAATNGGINPSNGKSVWEYADKDSLVKYIVLQENTKNADAFSSSTYMYLASQNKPMTFGPVWDFDDSYGIRDDKASPEGFACDGGYIALFLNLPDCRTSIKKYYSAAGYSKAVGAGIDKAVSEIAASQKMNRVLWNNAPQTYQKLETYESDVAYMKSFATARAKWLKGVYATW